MSFNLHSDYCILITMYFDPYNANKQNLQNISLINRLYHSEFKTVSAFKNLKKRGFRIHLQSGWKRHKPKTQFCVK